MGTEIIPPNSIIFSMLFKQLDPVELECTIPLFLVIEVVKSRSISINIGIASVSEASDESLK